ncbi:hypothetical protein BKA70DRAFT_1237628 [Coprinopsis sp. MPI-PUGE-AT-0042]|nr:hypothetical protein BKA70DRAFT_1237628 [Coprinopsis sp. MPI-PUGE-AT-0042]
MATRRRETHDDQTDITCSGSQRTATASLDDQEEEIARFRETKAELEELREVVGMLVETELNNIDNTIQDANRRIVLLETQLATREAELAKLLVSLHGRASLGGRSVLGKPSLGVVLEAETVAQALDWGVSRNKALEVGIGMLADKIPTVNSTAKDCSRDISAMPKPPFKAPKKAKSMTDGLSRSVSGSNPATRTQSDPLPTAWSSTTTLIPTPLPNEPSHLQQGYNSLSEQMPASKAQIDEFEGDRGNGRVLRLRRARRMGTMGMRAVFHHCFEKIKSLKLAGEVSSGLGRPSREHAGPQKAGISAVSQMQVGSEEQEESTEYGERGNRHKSGIKDRTRLKPSRKTWCRDWRISSKRVRAGFAIRRSEGGWLSKLSRFDNDDKKRDRSMSKSVSETCLNSKANRTAAVMTVPPAHPPHEVHHDIALQQQQERQQRPTKETVSPASELPDDYDATSLLSASSGGTTAGGWTSTKPSWRGMIQSQQGEATTTPAGAPPPPLIRLLVVPAAEDEMSARPCSVFLALKVPVCIRLESSVLGPQALPAGSTPCFQTQLITPERTLILWSLVSVNQVFTCPPVR